MLPLLPLTKGGNTLQAVEEMASELAARDRTDLLELGLFCGLVLKNKIDKQWLRERFCDMQSIIEDSWVYQEVIDKGRQQAFQQAAISVVKARFPELEPLATAIIEAVNDVQRLQLLIAELSIAMSQEQAKELLALTSDAK